MILYSIFEHNKIINNYILPLLLFLNIVTLLWTVDINSNILNIVNIVLLLYLLYIFDYRDFQVENGKLVNPNTKWISIIIGSEK